MRILAPALAACLLLAAGPAAGAARDSRPIGIYSNLRYIEESGDVVGMEVFIVGAGNGYVAMVQCAEGAPGMPALAPLKVDGDRLSFEVPASSGSYCPGEFSGRISDDGLRGRFQRGAEEEVLPRRNSYWQ